MERYRDAISSTGEKMSDPKIPAVVVDSEITPPLKERLLSLDIFRGMTLIAMTMVDMPGAEGFTYAAITHARWNGWSIADLIFPFFIFIVGVAMPYSYAKRLARGDSRGKLVAHILLRTVILFAIGVFMNVYFNYMDGLTRYHLYNFRIFNALQRIALCYFFASILYLRLKNRGLAITATAILVLYFILLKFVPVPGHGVGVLGIDGNWVQFIDLHVIAGHMGLGESTSWEPKGLLSTFPALANMLIGVLAGVYLRSPRSAMEKVRSFLVVGTMGLFLGLVWSVWFPINQNLWTSSLVVFMCGMALVILGCCYYVADVRKITWWTKPFVIVGVNSLFLWVMGGTTTSLCNFELIKISLANGTKVSLTTLIYKVFASWVGPVNGSELYAVAWTALWMGILTIMYKKRIIIKI
jgi:predicted acyltransferase